MKKKKPKKSPSKSPPKATSTPSPKISSTADPCPTDKDQTRVDSEVVFDAPIAPQADLDAQQPDADNNLASVNLQSVPVKKVIDTQVSDPSCNAIDNKSAINGSNSASPVQRSSINDSDILVSSAEELQTSAPLQVANADAKTNSLSSQDTVDAPVFAGTTSMEETGKAMQSMVTAINPVGSLSSQQISPASNVEQVDALVAQPVSETGKSTEEVSATPTRDKTNTPLVQKPQNPSDITSKPAHPQDDWCTHAKGLGKRLSKKGEAFTLPSGEACIKIPNSVIEKHRKSWEPFILGQFYSDPPSQGTLHNIVNGIWSKQYRDIAVSKMEGFSFLFRIPNAATRHRVITQRLWQIEGQTMFVDKWEPGVVPSKPELTSAPIWLELRKVPFQFFNEDGLERIAGLVGDPRFLHPSTKNKTNLEVAKVFTIIDPRKPLPEAVNVQFDSGDICRVLVSSPWMPPVCDLCKEVGHSSKRCPSVAKTCTHCNSKSHVLANCPQKQRQESPGRKTRRGRSKSKQIWKVVEPVAEPEVEGTKTTSTPPLLSPSLPAPAAKQLQSDNTQTEATRTEIILTSKLGTEKDKEIGETSNTPYYLRSVRPRSASAITRSSNSDIQPDSSDVESSESELEEGEFDQEDYGYEVVRNKKNFKGLKGNRGRGPKIN